MPGSASVLIFLVCEYNTLIINYITSETTRSDLKAPVNARLRDAYECPVVMMKFRNIPR